MTPLDVTDYSAHWDCVVPAREVNALRSSALSARTMQRYVFPAAVALAAVSAMTSSGILLSVAIIVAVSSLASVLYRHLHGRSERERRAAEIMDTAGTVIYRSEIERSEDAMALFQDAIDVADSLHDSIKGREYMENFANADMINDALWQCADALRTHEQRADAEAIIDNMRSAASSAAEITRSLESRQKEPEPGMPDDGLPKNNPSAQLDENMHALRESAAEIAKLKDGNEQPEA